MMVPAILLLCSILPAFHLILRYRTAFAFLAAYGVLSTLRAMSAGTIITWLTESLPPAFRSGGLAIIYAVSISVFGGSTQFVLAWLIKITGSPLAPAYYWTAATARRPPRHARRPRIRPRQTRFSGSSDQKPLSRACTKPPRKFATWLKFLPFSKQAAR